MPASTVLTVSVVDDDVQVRRLLVEVLASIGLGYEEYRSGDDFIRLWQPGSTDCVLLDVRMPRITGPEVHDWLREHSPDTPVIFISGYADVATAVRAMRLGAFDFIEKPFNVQYLIERVHAALRVAEERRRNTPQDGAVLEDWQLLLTPRERDVLEAIVAGKRNKGIAADLGISERTVETHRARLMSKTGATSVAELVGLVVGTRSKRHP